MDLHCKFERELLDKISQVILLNEAGLIIESDNCLVEMFKFFNKHVSQVFPVLHNIDQEIKNTSFSQQVVFPIVSEIMGKKGPFFLLGKKIKGDKKVFILSIQQITGPKKEVADSFLHQQLRVNANQIHSTIALNLVYLRKTLRGNPSFLSKLIESSIEDIPEYVTRLSLQLNYKNSSFIETISKLTAIFRLLGLYELANIAHSIEKKAASKTEDRTDDIEQEISYIKCWMPNIMDQLRIELRKVESFN